MKISKGDFTLRKKASNTAASTMQVRKGSVDERVERALAVASKKTGTFESKYAK